MVNKQKFLMIASFFALIFIVLGYLVKFYPDVLVDFDSSIHDAVRGDLPAGLTLFFRLITHVGDTITQVLIALVAFIFLRIKKWRVESWLVAGNAVLAGLAIMVFKSIYQRPRPRLEHLVHADGYSFPSGHSLGTMLIFGSLIIICYQRIQSRWLRYSVVSLFGLLIFLVGLSRVYHGVHYPSDVLAGFSLGLAILWAGYPYYANQRFQWCFNSRQD